MKIGIVVGSVRNGRIGRDVGEWVLQHASGAEFEIIDLLDFDLPFVSGQPAMTLEKKYDNENVTKFSQVIDSCDGFIFVTPEYNRSVPGSFKNAIDHLYSEWTEKPVGYVGYSYNGGEGAVAQWREIMKVLKTKDVGEAVSLNINNDFVDGKVTSTPELEASLKALVDRIIAAA